MSIKIKAVAFKDIKQVELVERETPDLRPDEVLVKVHAVALCTMEQRLFTGALKMPMLATGGHEVAGEIAAMGSAINKKKWAEHDRVVVRLLFNCGECYYCRTGHTNMCEKSKSRPVRENLLPGPGGGLADYVIVNAASLFKIPDTLSYEEACLTEPLACVVHSVNRANIQLGEDVVVIGGGIMGQYHVMLAKRKGARVILSEVDPARAELAKKLGADVVFNPIEVDPVEFVKSVTEGRGADVVFNTTAIASVVPQAIAMTGKAGRMVQYSSMHPDAPAPVSPQMLHGNEVVLTGSISPDGNDFFTANRLLNSGIIDCKPMIAKTFPLEQAQQAFEAATVPGTFRVIVTD